MELIDRKALINQLKEENIPFNSDINEIINIQPIAFDTEKFIAELEDKFEHTVAEILDKTGSDFTIADFNVKRYSDRICEIVRKGGVE